VLLQLPFEPVILQQWMVALLVEALRFQKKITDFTTMTYPEHLKSAVDKLIAIGSMLMNGANTFLSFVAKLVNVKDDSINHMHAISTLCWKEFQKILPPVLAALKFSLSEECDTLILELKRMAWSENEDARTCKSKIDFKMISSVYAHSYWDSRQWHKWILSVENDFVDDEPGALMVKNSTAKTKEEATNLDAFQTLIDTKIIKRLHGENKEIILKTAVENAESLKVFTDHYEHYIGNNYFSPKYSENSSLFT
jgi:hypothetical protein